ncbi:MAG TPA: hypothetical protein VG033_09990 [Candidatus Acidoferrales bacterium]|nr:hypothetical protein [Candidatus Acidoferrales bacterium]
MKIANLLNARPCAGSCRLAPAAALLLFFLPAGAASAQVKIQPQGPPAPGTSQLLAKPATPSPANFHVEYRAGRLSVHAVDAPLRRVVAEVARQSGIQIIGMENVRGRVSVDFSNEPLGPALTSLLIEVDYAISGDLAQPQGIAHATLLVMERQGAPARAGGPAIAKTTASAAKPDGTADTDADPDAPDPDADANADPDAPDPDADANADEDPNAAQQAPPAAQPPTLPPVYVNQPGQPGPDGTPGQPTPIPTPRRALPPGSTPSNPPGGAASNLPGSASPTGNTPANPPGAMGFSLASRTVQTLVTAIQSPNPAVQGPAFTNLSAIDSGAAVRAAISATSNPDAAVRLGGLMLLDSSSVAPEATVLQTLGGALSDKDEQVKDYALDALMRRDQQAAGYIAPLLKDSDPALRLRVVQDLAGKDWAAPLLRIALNDSDPSVRVAAAALVKPAPTAAGGQ